MNEIYEEPKNPEVRPIGAIPKEDVMDSCTNSRDNWQHRSHNIRCASCMWFLLKPKSGVHKNQIIAIGRCKKHSPTLNGFPVVMTTDWCGDHKIDEDKSGF